MAPGVTELQRQSMRLSHGYAARYAIVVGDATRRILLNGGEDWGGCGGREWRKAGTVGVQAFIVDRDVDSMVPHVADGERGHASHGLLNSEAPLLIVRSVEGPDLVIVGGGSEQGTQLRAQAAIGCPTVESRHDSRRGRCPLNVRTVGGGGVAPWSVVDSHI